MSIQITRLRHEARHHYLAYLHVVDGMDCGHAMAQTISADAATHAREFDHIMDQLAAIDPNCPKSRLVVAS